MYKQGNKDGHYPTVLIVPWYSLVVHHEYFVTDQLSRLHMILKPFMLRRVKKDVENELSDKVSLPILKKKLFLTLLIC